MKLLASTNQSPSPSSRFFRRKNCAICYSGHLKASGLLFEISQFFPLGKIGMTRLVRNYIISTFQSENRNDDTPYFKNPIKARYLSTSIESKLTAGMITKCNRSRLNMLCYYFSPHKKHYSKIHKYFTLNLFMKNHN